MLSRNTETLPSLSADYGQDAAMNMAKPNDRRAQKRMLEKSARYEGRTP